MTYLITFACYRHHLHGDDSGAVDRSHNAYESPKLPAKPRLAAYERKLSVTPYELDAVRRDLVLASIRAVCTFRRWNLLAAHVRTNHVHLVVDADEKPEKVMNDAKPYASRCLNAIESPRNRWARHGSTRWLWDHEQISAAIRYVISGQGEALAAFEA